MNNKQRGRKSCRDLAHWHLAKCPKCGELHKVKTDWTGTGLPWIYHQRCREIIRRIEDGEEECYGATHRND